LSGTTVPIVLTAAGMTPATPAALQQQLIANVVATNPGYTSNLPGTLIEDISSTCVGALLQIDSALVDTVNSLTPYGINEFLLTQLGNVYGLQQGVATNTSVYVVFTGSVGYVVPIGFLVSDGTYQYSVQDGGIIQSGGATTTLYCLATVAGTFAVPANTVTQLATSVPVPYTLAVTNPNPGTPGTGTAETYPAYRARLLEAGLGAALGMPDYVKRQIKAVPGVQANLVSVAQQTFIGWRIIVGGGDPYAVAYAIYTAILDISTLVGSAVSSSRNITVTLNNPPNNYAILFVNPVVQSLQIQVTWNTIATNYVSNVAVAALAQPALIAYATSLTVGAPLNLFELQATFQLAVASVVPTALLTRMVFTVTINSTEVNPESGTGIIQGDLEGYYTAATTTAVISQG